jgi:2-hydroxychromene-2-carboxylate isomerase
MAPVLRGFVNGMATHTFSVTWDYRCPFAYRAHDHVVAGLLAGADWDVTFTPFSLGQVHVKEGETDIWERPGDDTGLLALQAGVVVRDQFANAFLPVHRSIFELRHRHAGQLDDETALASVLGENGVDANVVFSQIAAGWPLETIRKEHEASVAEHTVWGVPTFIAGDEAVFVRLMNASEGDGAGSQRIVERLLDTIVGWPELNEFKHTSIPR